MVAYRAHLPSGKGPRGQNPAYTQRVDKDASKARFDNGVLRLTLPKKAATSAQRLAID